MENMTILQNIQFNPSLQAIKYRNGTVHMEPKNVIDRWKEYFEELINGKTLIIHHTELIKYGGENLCKSIRHEVCKYI